MKLKLLVTALALAALASPLAAQDNKQAPQMSAQEQKEMQAWMQAGTPGDAHKALNGMVGTWDAKVTMWNKPGAPPMSATGVSENKWILGGRWIEQRYEGTMMGAPFSGIGYSGYDNVKKKYVGTWMDTMSTAVMNSVATGGDAKSMTFRSSMDDPMTGKAIPVTEKINMTDADHMSFEMWVPGPDGKVFKTMQIDYTRKK